MVDMTTNEYIYEMPNLGCLLGMAYQAEAGRLNAALSGAGLDITAAEYVILRLLLANGTMQQCEIGRILNKDKASVSRTLQSLSKKGLVNANPISRKCCMASLTAEGEALRARLLEIAKSLQNGLSERITPQQMAILREILETIIQ